MAIARILLPVLVMAASVVVAGGSSALLIVDVQNCFTSGGSLAVPDGDAVVPVINGLREDYGQYFDAVVLSQDWHCPDHVSFASQHPGRNPFDQVDLTYRLSTGQRRYTSLNRVARLEGHSVERIPPPSPLILPNSYC